MASGQSRIARLVLPVAERDHIQGPVDAPCILLEYGDYQCPYCGQAYSIVKEVQRRLGRRLCMVYRHFPLAEIHPYALMAAEAAEAAGAQGRFGQMHDTLFENQDALGEADLVRYAGAIGLDVRRFVADLAQRTHEDRVREDFMSGVRSGVNGTPTFFINGRRHDGPWDADTLSDALLAAARVPA
jgi:protein-disulfide isomerase